MCDEFIEIGIAGGLRAVLSSYGASLVALYFPDKEGNPTDCVLGFGTVDEYKKDNANLGRTVGRVCNRIRNGTFVFHDKEYTLPVNNPPHNLHSGPGGIALRDWELVRRSTTSATFRIDSDESIDGLPGDAHIDVTYTVNDRNQLVVEHFATCKQPGVLNLTNHSYWNLDGSDTIHNHKVRVQAHEYLPVDATSCPTGAQLSVKTTMFDLNEEQLLHNLSDQFGFVSIDHDLILDPSSHSGCNVLSLSSEKSGISMSISTSYPAIHLYGGRHLRTVGKEGIPYGPCKGLAIEPQFHSAAVNYPNFPSIECSIDKPYSEEIIYTFSHI